MKTAIYPGTFDPLTLGHLDVIERAAALFDKVIVTIANNRKKTPLFTVEERLDQTREAVKKFTNVSCEQFDGLIVDFARQHKANVLIRGVRVISDFEYELQMGHVNRRLDPSIVTVFLMPGEKYAYLNSSIVKEVAAFGGDISAFVLPFIEAKIKEKIQNRKS